MSRGVRQRRDRRSDTRPPGIDAGTLSAARWYLDKATLALIASAVALGIALWQAIEAHSANALTKEALRIEAEPDYRNLVVSANCLDNGTEQRGVPRFQPDITLRWKISVFNASSLPVTVKELSVMGETPSGRGFVVTDDEGQKVWPNSKVIGPKEFLAYYFEVPSAPSPEFATWFAANGGCEGKIDWANMEDSRGFNAGGWRDGESVSVVVTAKTGLDTTFVSRTYLPKPPANLLDHTANRATSSSAPTAK